MKVFVYYHIRKKCWSIRAMEGPDKGRVIAHMDDVDLFDCEFKVSLAGNARVRREGRKNVHAGVQGFLVEGFLPIAKDTQADRVRYNPYKYTSFVYDKTEHPIRFSNAARLTASGLVWALTGEF